jgi:DNA modification methylase
MPTQRLETKQNGVSAKAEDQHSRSGFQITRTELVWPGKYKEDGSRKELPRVSLPFQVIETINQSRATREASKTNTPSLFEFYHGKEGDTFEAGWKNKLVWGDNLLVMGSLLEKFAGKIDLIYIDPPFATGADFSFTAHIGERDLALTKDPSVIEEKAYRDTWGSGYTSYLDMLAARLGPMRDLLSARGTLYVHLDYHVCHYVKVLLDELFGPDRMLAEIVWKRKDAQSFATGYGVVHDIILAYTKSDEFLFNKVFLPLSEDTADTWYTNEEIATKDVLNRSGSPIKKGTVRRFNKADISAPGDRKGTKAHYEWNGVHPPPGRHWAYTADVMKTLDEEGRLVYSESGRPYEKRYLDESKGTPLQTIWSDISQLRGMSKRSAESEWLDYATQKPRALLERIIEVSSQPGSLIADFFLGSGTSMEAAESMGRRWIGCDLSRWAVHTTRKRMLAVEKCRPFEVLNLGKYERKYWQGVTFSDHKRTAGQQIAIFQYIAFILKLYAAQPLTGMQHLHGKKGKAMVHVGAVDAPVTIDEINACIEEGLAVQQTELHVLGWEWEMGLANLMVEEAKRRGAKLLLLNIPREVMEQQAVDKGDIRFFEVAHLEVKTTPEKGRQITVALKDFAFPYADLIPEEVRAKIKKWSDYIDYWAVDWDFQNDTFMNGWVAYRTRKERSLTLESDQHTYEKPGTYAVMVKAVDIFGNDTSQSFEVEVK